jgi:AcrR family transcriptional regulator
MAKKAKAQPQEKSLSKERIIEASIALLDEHGESGLTFRALSEELATGAGAIYWHIENKSELLTAACDEVIARTLNMLTPGAPPASAIRELALKLFDAIDAHPWVGSAIILAPGEKPVIRIFEQIGQHIQAIEVSEGRQWVVASTLLHYILGVSALNAANSQIAQQRSLERTSFLTTMSQQWSQLDQHKYPFTRNIAGQLPAHDDREDFLIGIDLILEGISSLRISDSEE